jgi:hypothetical protein
MNFSRILSALSFIGALTIGITIGYFSNGGAEAVPVVEPIALVEFTEHIDKTPLYELHPDNEIVPLETTSVLGVWKGSWGYGLGDCMIEIDRIKGSKFFGTLRKEGAEIAIVGTIDVAERSVFFHETKVIKLGPEMASWSLGTNAGTFSDDGRSLTGTGTDKWGSYGWEASKD